MKKKYFNAGDLVLRAWNTAQLVMNIQRTYRPSIPAMYNAINKEKRNTIINSI